MWQKILLIVGIVGIVIGGIALVIAIMLSAGFAHSNPEEATPVFFGSGCCCSLSLVLAIVGLIFVLKNRKNPPAGPNTPPKP